MTHLRLPAHSHDRDVTRAIEACELIAAKDRSNLYFVSQFLEDRARYEAFVAMYAVMRLIDDAVDNTIDKSDADAEVRSELLAQLDRWENRIADAYDGAASSDVIDTALSSAVRTFPLPLRMWRNFMASMRYDVEVPGFASYADFLRYGEGATVAPTVIYVYILTAVRDHEGVYRSADFDYESCGRDLGLFAYLGHILRDVRQDALVGKNGLVYLSDADLRLYGLERDELRKVAIAGNADSRWTALARDLCARARDMAGRGAALAEAQYGVMQPDCAFILCLIITLYRELLRRIDEAPERVFLPEPMISDREKAVLATDCARRVGYSLVKVARRLAAFAVSAG